MAFDLVQRAHDLDTRWLARDAECLDQGADSSVEERSGRVGVIERSCDLTHTEQSVLGTWATESLTSLEE